MSGAHNAKRVGSQIFQYPPSSTIDIDHDG
jgi:hypothetical protein